MGYDTEDTDCLDLPVADSKPGVPADEDITRQGRKRREVKAWAAQNAPKRTPDVIFPNELPKVPRSERLHPNAVDPVEAVKVVSRRYTHMAFARLAWIAEHSNNHSAAIAAIKEILERAWGKTHIHHEAETKPGTNIVVSFGDRPQVKVVEGDTPTVIEDVDDGTD